jgi:hypothetical protein
MKKLIREYGAMALERELHETLLGLRSDFDRWQAGEISSVLMNEKIHEFTNGPTRDLLLKYHPSNPQAGLASAIASGLVKKDEVPPELLEYLARSIESFEDETHTTD